MKPTRYAYPFSSCCPKVLGQDEVLPEAGPEAGIAMTARCG